MAGDEREQAGAGPALDWQGWHSAYEDPQSPLGRRLALVRGFVADALDAAPAGPLRAVSICAGQGHDLIGVLAGHVRREDVSARLVELDAENVLAAGRAAVAAGLDRVEARVADASLSDSYAGAVPADLVLVCGVFGNISDDDVERLVGQLPQLCAPAAHVVWTRHRNPPDLVPRIRAALAGAGFEEVAFADAHPFGVGAARLVGEPRPLARGVRMFDFIGQRALWPHLPERRRAALEALFRPDCSIVELVEAMRALPIGLPSRPTPEMMLREARGTSWVKHRFLAEVLAARFPATEPAIVHRVYRLEREAAERRFGSDAARVIPDGGILDIHRYLTIAATDGRSALDATFAGEPWDGRSPLAPAFDAVEDVLAGADPDADLAALEAQHCDRALRAPFLAALAVAALPAPR